MARENDKLHRLWKLLQKIPHHPRKITARELRDFLNNEENLEITERSVQRDLHALCRDFALVADERNKPFGWGWSKDARALNIPSLTLDEAITWVLAEEYIGQMLPTSAMGCLRPYFNSARNRLDGEPQPQKGRSWLNKIRSVSPTQPLIPPEIDTEIQHTISEALFNELQIEIHYRRKGEHQTKHYRIHPLALIQRGAIIYLYGRISDYPNARLLALHRIEQVRVLDDQPAVAPEGFDLDQLLKSGGLGFGLGKTIRLQLKFRDGKGEHLHETPLDLDQQITESATHNGELIISAHVADTPQLKWWLLGFGDGVEVLAPESLRQEMSETAAKMVARYQLPASTQELSVDTNLPSV